MVAFLLSAVVASIFTPVSESSAQTIKVQNNATGYYVAVTSADKVSLSVDATPTGSTVISDASVVNVKTNAPLGYKLYLSTENNELTSTDSAITQTFKPVTSTSLTTNTWGFSTTGVDNSWLAVPEVTSGNESSGYLLSSSTTPNIPDGDNIDVYYGINSDTAMPSGTYTTTVTYTAIGDGIPEEHTMQEFTMSECINMPTDQTFYLIDSRNNKIYSIIHARDGNCWMTQNLSIYNQAISSADSNLPEGTTAILPASENWGGNIYNAMKIHVSDGAGSYADKTGEYDGEVYYNWCAALGRGSCTETNVTVNQSICPKGWRLPINGDTTTDKSWAKLMDTYSISTGADLVSAAQSQTAYQLGFHKYYGFWNQNQTSEFNQGAAGYFHSSTASSGTNVYYFEYNSAFIYPQRYNLRGNGFSIRCVFAPSMQDFSATDCAKISADTQFVLTDTRNYKQYKIIKARDGNCWMADNLAIYNQQISSADSDLPSGTSITLPASTTWNTNNYSAMLIHVANGTGNYANKTGTYYGEVYYNWCIAIGKSTCSEGANVTVNQSICPKGWRLPINGGSTVNKTWAKLMNVYGIDSGAQLVDSSNPAYILGFHKYYGYWNWAYVSEFNQGSGGHFWSSTASSEGYVYAPVYSSTGIKYESGHKGCGLSIRCVLK